MSNGWIKKFKGNERGGAFIYTHPSLTRAIVENQHGVRYDGQEYPSVSAAKHAALGKQP